MIAVKVHLFLAVAGATLIMFALLGVDSLLIWRDQAKAKGNCQHREGGRSLSN